MSAAQSLLEDAAAKVRIVGLLARLDVALTQTNTNPAMFTEARLLRAEIKALATLFMGPNERAKVFAAAGVE